MSEKRHPERLRASAIIMPAPSESAESWGDYVEPIDVKDVRRAVFTGDAADFGRWAADLAARCLGQGENIGITVQTEASARRALELFR